MKAEVHDTAFVIAHYRAQNDVFSKDLYAYIWDKPALIPLSEGFSEHVSPHDAILHQARNRIFQKKLSMFTSEVDNALFLNIGAGFSMYPYCLPEDVTTIEVDFENVLRHKAEVVSKTKGLPKRDIRYMAGDATEVSFQKEIKEVLNDFSEAKKIVLIEGVFFFLSKDQIQRIFNFLKEVLGEGDVVLTISYDRGLESCRVFESLKNYFAEVLEGGHNTTLPHKFYEQQPGFKLMHRDSTFACAQRNSMLPQDLEEAAVLNEYCYTLQRKKIS